MICTEIRSQITSVYKEGVTERTEFSKLISAAVINPIFRNLLLHNPRKAIAEGFAGENFYISIFDQQKISQFRANSLSEFAQKIMEI